MVLTKWLGAISTATGAMRSVKSAGAACGPGSEAPMSMAALAAGLRPQLARRRPGPASLQPVLQSRGVSCAVQGSCQVKNGGMP